MKNSKEFQIGCCGSRKLSLVIGWLQAIISALGLVVVLVHFVMFLYGVLQGYRVRLVSIEDAPTPAPWVVLAILLILGLPEFIGGIFLILGVNQQNLGKIKVWKVQKIIAVVITSIYSLILLLNYVVNPLLDIASIVFSIIFLWIVGIHEKELRATSGGLQK